jgi:Universal stress protein family
LIWIAPVTSDSCDNQLNLLESARNRWSAKPKAMNQTTEPDIRIKRVLHPTDSSEASTVAFHHALRVTLLTKSKLNILSVASDRSEWEGFPGIRETLERWQLLPKGSPPSAVPKLGINARKIVAENKDPVDAVLRFLKSRPVDLIIVKEYCATRACLCSLYP